MTSRQQRCSRRSAACCLILALQGQSFFITPSSCFPNAQRPSCTRAAGQPTSARAAATRPLSSLNSAPCLATSQGQAKPPGQWSPIRPDGKAPGEDDNDDEFNINVGRALDYLAADVALMFSTAPRLEIFTPDVRLKVRALKMSSVHSPKAF